MSFIEQIKQRRSIYAIGKNISQTPEQLDAVIQEAVKQSPSSFNSQSSRAVTLYGDSHTKFWEIVRETLRKMVPEENFESTSQKIDSSFPDGPKKSEQHNRVQDQKNYKTPSLMS